MTTFGDFTAEAKVGEEKTAGNLEELRYMQQLYQSQYGMVTEAMNAKLRELQELNRTRRTLDESDKVQGNDALLQLGAGFYLKSRVEESGNVIVGIGGGYLIEKDIPSAKMYATKLIKEKTGEVDALVKNRRELESAIMDISYRIEGLMR